MENSEARRIAAKRVAVLLRHPEATKGFSAVLANGKRQVLIALDDDTVGPLFKRVKAFRGPVNIVVAKGDEFSVLVGQHSESNKKSDGVDCPLTSDSEVGMLVALLRETGKPARCRLVEPNYQLELIDPYEKVPAEL